MEPDWVRVMVLERNRQLPSGCPARQSSTGNAALFSSFFKPPFYFALAAANPDILFSGMPWGVVGIIYFLYFTIPVKSANGAVLVHMISDT
jgi:hypothetical protein